MSSRFLVLLFAAACASGPRLSHSRASPDAPAVSPARAPVVERLHGQDVADPFRWLEAETSPEVQAFLARQDEAARHALAGLPHREALARRFRELYYVESVSAPVQRGERLFYLRRPARAEKAVLVWRETAAAPERVLLDPNTWSADGTVSLGSWTPSWDGRKLAFQRRPHAADEAVLHVVDVDSGIVSERDVIPGGKYAGAHWTPDGAGFYYEWLPTDPAIPVDERPGHVAIRYHALGTDPAQDPIVHPPTGDPTALLRAGLSRDGRYLFAIVRRGWAENSIFFKDLREDGPFRPLVEGRNASYQLLAHQDRFYLVTDEGASNRRVFAVDPRHPQRAHWEEIVPEDPEAALDRHAIGLAGGHLVLHYLRRASSEVRLVSLDGRQKRLLALPGIVSVSALRGQRERDELWLEISSFTSPRQVYRGSVKTGQVELWAEVSLPMDPEAFETRQVHVPSKDGTPVSVFLVHRKGLALDGDNPTLLTGYGGFNVALTPSFRASIIPWLEAGGVYAVANLRGGGEYGKKWHDAGRGANKQNVFDDFIAVSEWLIARGYTRPARLGISGGSNGGLLVGAALTQRPDLYGAVVCAVPLLDMVRYHLFGSGRTWIPEYGTAEKAEDFRVLYAYSPYHRVQPGTRYPPLLMLSADRDDRVDPMHARKFVAAVQAASADNVALLRVERNAGHGGADLVRQAIEQSADQYAFLMERLGVAAPLAR